MHTIELAIIGSTIVRVDGLPVGLSVRERSVLTALATEHPLPVALGALVDAIWVHDPPQSCRQIVQNNVSALRRRFSHESILTEVGPTYRLGPGWTLDLDRFTRHVDAARRAGFTNDHRAEVSHFRRALDLVRGEPFQDLASGAAIEARRARSQHLVLTAQEDGVLAELAAGNVAAAISSASALAPAEPYRELRWSLLALALYRSGDRRGSLEAVQRARRTLGEGAGLDPGPTLLRLERMIFDDDPRLSDAAPRAVLGLDHSEQVSLDRILTRFVGAERDIDRVRSLCARALESDTSSWITVTGEHPLATAAFSQQIALDASLDGWTVLEARCSSQAFQVLEPLGALARRAVELMPDPAGMLDESALTGLAMLWGDDAGDGRDSNDPGAAAIDVMVRSAERSPTLLLIEEAQHLTTSATGYLAQLASMPVPLVLLAVGSTVAVPVPDGAEVIRLGTILIDPGADGADEHSMGSAGEAINVRSAAVDDVATTIAVAGSPLSYEILVDTGRFAEDLRTLLVAAVDLGVLAPARDGGFELTDSSLGDALVDRLDVDTSREIHSALASSLLSHRQVFAAAPHLLASSGDPELVIDNVTAAASQATSAAMFVEAAALLDQAVVRSAGHTGANAEGTLHLMLARAENLRRAGDPAYLDVIWEVVRRSDEAQLHTIYALAAAALCKLGPLTDAGALDERVVDVVARALIRCDDAEARARCAGEATLFFSMAGRVDLCREYFDEALSLARQVGDESLMISALGNAYLVLTHPSEVLRRKELASEMLARAERCDDDDARCEALHFMFSVQLQQCDPMLRTSLERQVALAERLGPGRRWMAEYQRCTLAFIDGRLDEALDLASGWTQRAPVSAARAATTHAMVLLVVRLAQGRGDELREQIDQAIIEHAGMPAWRGIAAYLAAQRGDSERVLSECDAVGNGAGLPFDLAWGGAVMLLGRAVATTGDRPRAAQLLDLIAPHAGTFTWIGSITVGPFDLALAELALALGEIDAAGHHVASLERCVELVGATVYEPDVVRLRREIDHARSVSPDPAAVSATM